MKTKTKILSVLMTVAILLSSLVLVFPTYAAEGEGDAAPVIPITNWSENAATGFANGGDGSEGNPYIISTAAELAYLANAVEADPEFDTGKYFKLADANGNAVTIDLSAHLWDKPIGSFGKAGTADNARFCGNFNGNGSAIKGMIVRKTVAAAGDATALFGAIAGGVTVENFTLEADIEATITIKSQYSSISAVTGIHGGFSYLKNVHATANIVATQGVNGENNGQNSAIGGLTGLSWNSYMQDCSMSGEMTVYTNPVGGSAYQTVLGGITSSHVGALNYLRVTNNMNITLHKGNANTYAGGIIGAAGFSNSDKVYDVTFTGCVNNGNIYAYTDIATYGGANTNSDNMRFGGIIGGTGRNVFGSGTKHPVLVQQCINTGNIGGERISYDASGNPKSTAIAVTGTSGGSFGMIVGQVEHPLTIKQCFVPYLESNLANKTALYHFRTGSAASGYIVTDGHGQEISASQGNYGIGSDSDIMMEVGVFKTDDAYAYVGISTDALTAFKTAGFEFKVTYGAQEITSYDALDWTTEAEIAIAKFNLEADAVPACNVYTTVNGQEFVYNAIEGLSWAGLTDMLAEKDIPFDDAQQAWLVSTPEQLASIANSVNRYQRCMSGNTKRFLLVNDIDLAGFEWMPIGSTHGITHSFFAGIIDGANFSIKNMTLTRDKYLYCQGFIGYMQTPSTANITTVKNVTFESPVIRVADQSKVPNVQGAAVVAGAMYSGVIDNVHVTDLDLTYDTACGKDILCGGLVGYAAAAKADNGNSISDSSVQGRMTVDIEASDLTVGGLIGRGRAIDVSNCETDVDIDILITRPEGAKDGGSVFAGGIVGRVHANNDTEFVNLATVSSKGDIYVATDANDGSKFGNIGVGGFVGGAAFNGGTIATGSLTVTNGVSMGALSLENYVELVGSESVGSFIGNDLLSVEATVTLDNCIGFNTDVAIGNQNAAVMNANCTAGNLSLAIQDGARVRIAPDALENSGLRFDALINYDYFTALKAAGYMVNAGVAITPEGNLAAVNGDWAALEEDVMEGMLTVDAVAVTEATAANDFNFTGAIINLDSSNYTTNFTATAYFQIIFNGDVITIFADNTTTRSIKDVAQSAITDPYGDYTAEQLAILNAYVAK